MPFERSPFVYTDMVLALRREASLRSATPVAMGAMRREDFFARALVAISTARALFISAHFNAFDCDESFNYWEPLHFLTFGHGLQTWEHGDAFALRSYAYLFAHWPIGAIVRAVAGVDAKRAAFVATRAALGGVAAWFEADLVDACAKRRPLVGGVLIVLLATSGGMAVASTSMLPSSFAMTCVTAATAATLRGEHARACVACVVAVVFGWPFSGIAAVPFGLYSVYGIGVWRTARVIVVATTAAAVVSVACDTYMYNPPGNFKAVSSVVNLLRYNVASGKSDLYGVEGMLFYVKNLALNFQLALVFAALAPFAVAIAVAAKAWNTRVLLKTKKQDAKTALAEVETYRNSWRVFLAVCTPFPLVTTFFTMIPHKEERFLYMIYPSLCLSAAVAVAAFGESALAINRHTFGKSRFRERLIVFGVVASLLATAVCSVSRTMALLKYYGAPAKMYAALPKPSTRADGVAWPAYLAEEFEQAGADATVNVCVGDEWYRFPSSYHFPSNRYRLRFIKGGFNGALPMPFDPARGGSAHTPEGLNDDNEEHPNQYVDPSDCRFLVEARFDESNTHSRSKAFASGDWVDVKVEKFLDATRSPTLTRIFYLPGLSERRNAYVDYALLVRASKPEY